jgi:hypothetical protein
MRHEQFSVNELIVSKILNPYGGNITPGANPTGGMDYYVDGNATKGPQDGLSWDTAVDTLAEAITLSNASIGLAANRWWARRNRIFLVADLTTESLTTFPNKCDVIGLGSYDANTKAGLKGNHAPVNAGNYGTRFINVWFQGLAAAAPVVDLASSSSGIQFIGCTFDGSLGTMTYAIRATASPFLVVRDCDFFGPFATGYITFGTGETGGTIIEDSIMHGSSGLGISSVTGTTASYQSFIRNCTIITQTTGLCIDDDATGGAGIFYCFDLRCKNGATLTNYAGRTGILDINETRALNVQYTGADVAGYIPLWTLT